MTSHLTAFLDQKRVAAGTPAQVAVVLKELANGAAQSGALVFEDASGRQIDLDLSGSSDDVGRRYAAPAAAEEAFALPTDGGDPSPAGRGRPRLGVVAREVTLLPRHWDWLAAQPGGASVALRKLVEEARKRSAWEDTVRRVREATGRFLTAIAGDLPGYEEASRALYAGDAARFDALSEDWPVDIRDHARALAHGSFA